MKSLTTPTSLIIHGHFYQPPRENPQVDLIPKQPTAKPYQDWNEQIYDTCYRPNSGSRYLNPYGNIERIINNYQYISFDFGPTLMTWLKRYHSDTYDLIIDADKKSIERLGHGNAMAQSFNHTILPLDTPRDARMQIDWGIDDFYRRFGRAPEGMWLPEAAVNPAVVDILSEAGIRFVVLSPWQCASYEDDSGNYVPVYHAQVPYDVPFLLHGKQGRSISAFFYHPALAHDISFQHALRDADVVYERLNAIRNNERVQLINTATDGEIYGHHEPFGDMALAAIINKTQSGTEFSLTNYATYLAEHPAKRSAILSAGDEELGTSWSCSHGVSRWYKDCGCHTGGDEGWNQLWRTPLRKAVSSLGEQIDRVYETEMQKLGIDAWKLLRDYGSVISEHETVETFLQRKRISDQSTREVAQLLAGQKFKYFSMTSCGWFFSDIGGLEPRQNIKYAVEAAKLHNQYSEQDLLDPLLSTLQLAKSNRRGEGSGLTIAKTILDAASGRIEAAGYFVLNRKFALAQDYVQRYGKFSLERYMDIDQHTIEIELKDLVTTVRHTGSVRVVMSPDSATYQLDIELCDKQCEELIEKRRIAIDSIPPRITDEAFRWIDNSLSSINDDEVLRIAGDIEHYTMLLKTNRSTPNEIFHTENIGTCLRALRSIFTAPNTIRWDKKRDSVSQLLEFVRRRGRTSDIATVISLLSGELDRFAKLIVDTGYNQQKGKYVLDILRLSRKHGFEPSLTAMQNAVYPHLDREEHSELLNSLRLELNFA